LATCRKYNHEATDDAIKNFHDYKVLQHTGNDFVSDVKVIQRISGHRIGAVATPWIAAGNAPCR
jgi:hypothetical protein